MRSCGRYPAAEFFLAGYRLLMKQNIAMLKIPS